MMEQRLTRVLVDEEVPIDLEETYERALTNVMAMPYRSSISSDGGVNSK